MFNLYKILFFNFLIIGTLITISSYSFFSMWMGLEINLLSIIPLFKSNKNFYATESMIKYFITQAIASSMILFIIIFILNFNKLTNNFWIINLLNSTFLIKLGAAPFHFWFPEVSEGLNWMNNFLLLTWQKLAPFILVMYNFNVLFLSFIIIISSMIGGIMGLNQVSLRKIMVYSSINHIAWMLASMMNLKSIWLMYYSFYSLMSFNLILIFYFLNNFYLQQLYNSLNLNKMVKIMFLLNFFSLGGLPPFLGFYIKWLVMNFLIYNNFYWISFILILMTLIPLYFYTRIILMTLNFSFQETLNNLKMNNFNIIFLNFFTIMSLIFMMNFYIF